MDILYVGTVQATQIPSFPRTSAVQIATRLRQVSHVNRRSNQHRRGLDEQLLEKKSIDYLSRLKLIILKGVTLYKRLKDVIVLHHKQHGKLYMLLNCSKAFFLVKNDLKFSCVIRAFDMPVQNMQY